MAVNQRNMVCGFTSQMNMRKRRQQKCWQERKEHERRVKRTHRMSITRVVENRQLTGSFM